MLKRAPTARARDGKLELPSDLMGNCAIAAASSLGGLIERMSELTDAIFKGTGRAPQLVMAASDLTIAAEHQVSPRV